MAMRRKNSIRLAADALEDIARGMDRLPWSEQKSVMKSVLRKVLQPVKRRAAALVPAPGYPGDDPQFEPLKNQMRIVVKSYSLKKYFAAVGPTWPEGAHAHLVHDGTDPHWVQPVFRQVMASQGKGSDAIYGKGHAHPGATENEFITQAWQQLGAKVERDLMQLLAAEIEKRYAKLARQAERKAGG